MDDLRRFFVDASILGDTEVVMPSDLAHRLARVLRFRAGDRIVLTSGGATEYIVELTAISAKSAAAMVVGEHPSPPEPAVEVVLYQSLIRANRFDYAIEKGTEVGVARFVPLVCARSQTNEEPSAGRTERWQRLIVEAAEQCGRGSLPTVAPTQPFTEAIAKAPGLRILPWEEERDIRLSDYLRSLAEPPTTVSVFIGPEGGYTDEEITLSRASGAALVTLGRRVLRSETAAAIAPAIILHELDS